VVARLTAAAAARWERDRTLLAEVEPGLTLHVDDQAERARVEGQIRVARPSGRAEAFDVVIKYPGLDPFEVPHCYDEVERFPRIPDRHVESDGRFCMWLPWLAPAREFRTAEGLAIYLARVQEFIGLQLQYEARERRGIKPFWPGPQWGHGADGFREWFTEQTRTLTAVQLANVLRDVYRNGKAGRRCPCGSRRRFSNCHKQFLRELRVAWLEIPSARAISYAELEARRAA
jgi:hypothetical protein